MKAPVLIHVSLITVALTATPAVADVQFRISHEASSNEYVVYMTPDSTPSPDMVLSSQVSVVVPHQTDGNRFTVSAINSAITGITWTNHSRVDAPTENPTADYLSFGLMYTGGMPPAFGWQANKEQRIFSFTSPSGCVAGIKLLDNSDPFSQLPNSVDTNPGNEFSNIGWLSANAYTGNYGESVQCNVTLPVKPLPACERNSAKVGAAYNEINQLNTLLNKFSPSTQRTNLLTKLEELRSTLKCQ